jgi:hypothetical protein
MASAAAHCSCQKNGAANQGRPVYRVDDLVRRFRRPSMPRTAEQKSGRAVNAGQGTVRAQSTPCRVESRLKRIFTPGAAADYLPADTRSELDGGESRLQLRSDASVPPEVLEPSARRPANGSHRPQPADETRTRLQWISRCALPSKPRLVNLASRARKAAAMVRIGTGANDPKSSHCGPYHLGRDPEPGPVGDSESMNR